MMTKDELLIELTQRLDGRQHILADLDRYYSGTQRLAYIAPEDRVALGDRLTVLNSNIARLAVTSLSERLRITGFTLDGRPDDLVWSTWLRCDLDQLAGAAHREALTLGKAYLLTWVDSAGRARVSVESARQVAHLTDPGSREVVAAVKVWETSKTTEALLFEPDRITRYTCPQTGGTVAGFTAVEVLDNPVGEVVVTPMVNADRLLDTEGVSEMADLLPLIDGQTKLLSDLMVGSELYARPRRFATGVKIARDKETGAPINPFPEGNRMMISESPDAKFGSLPAADLAGYRDALDVLTQQISAVSALPAHMLGITSSNPASADAIRSAEAGLTARAAARQATFGRAWERVARHVHAVEKGVDPSSITSRIVWCDPSTRSVAAEADSLSKLVAAGILTTQEARKRLGLTQEELSA